METWPLGKVEEPGSVICCAIAGKGDAPADKPAAASCFSKRRRATHGDPGRCVNVCGIHNLLLNDTRSDIDRLSCVRQNPP
jgi:hypothetical protein